MVRQAVFLVDLNYVPDALVSLRDVPYNTVIHAFYSPDVMPSLLDFHQLHESDARRIHLHKILYGDLYTAVATRAGMLHGQLPEGKTDFAAFCCCAYGIRFRVCGCHANERRPHRTEVATGFGRSRIDLC